MKIIIAIDLLSQLTTSDLLQKSIVVGITLHYPDLYRGTMLNHSTLERLRYQKSNLIEIKLSEEEMLHYHQEFTRCDQHRCLTFEDYVAVAYAKSKGMMLLADKGFLCRYAISNGVEVISLKELEEYCLQRQRQVRSRKERLRSHFDNQELITEKEPMQQSIDDDTTF